MAQSYSQLMDERNGMKIDETWRAKNKYLDLLLKHNKKEEAYAVCLDYCSKLEGLNIDEKRKAQKRLKQIEQLF